MSKQQGADDRPHRLARLVVEFFGIRRRVSDTDGAHLSRMSQVLRKKGLPYERLSTPPRARPDEIE